ncbi:LutC/YkgG family protein [Allonocardiopsis opalescens]|uniref:LutC/YkgG family protein n=1 Tax=Allonocardiopsis opalescens TaxID=1144618 RepID=UPI0011B21F95|nr:lactate utilization protein [Allonocardiopsis opalescens]
MSGDAGGGHGAAAGDALAGPAAADPGGAATAAGGGAGNLADRFAAALEAVGGRVHRAADPAEAAERVRGLCGERPVAADRDEVLAGVVSGLVLVDDPWAAEFGLTTALAAAADTGTLALAYDRDHPRGTSLVPPVHIAVVPADRLVPGYADAVARLAALRPVPSGMQMISGPSSSGDIEMELVRGMHGPLALHVVLVGG